MTSRIVSLLLPFSWTLELLLAQPQPIRDTHTLSLWLDPILRLLCRRFRLMTQPLLCICSFSSTINLLLSLLCHSHSSDLVRSLSFWLSLLEQSLTVLLISKLCIFVLSRTYSSKILIWLGHSYGGISSWLPSIKRIKFKYISIWNSP